MSQPGIDPRALLRDGHAALARGDALRAERCGKAVLAKHPGEPAASMLVAIALNMQARFAEAAAMFAELTRRQPRVSGHWMNLGNTLRAQRRFDESLQAFARAAELGERSIDFKYNVGLLHIDRGDPASAVAVLREAVDARPADAEIAYHFALAAFDANAWNEGAAALVRWPTFTGLSTELTARIAALLFKFGEAGAATAALERALADPSPDAVARLQVVLGLERMNRIDEARRTLDRLLAEPYPPSLEPEVRTAQARLAQRSGDHELAARTFAQLSATCGDLERRHFFQFPLARSLDELGRYDEAFAVLEEAHASQIRYIEATTPEVVRRNEDTMWITRQGVDVADVAAWNEEGPPAEASPVFIVAYPRSGTTLLEQALDAHPRLVSMDEQPFIQATLDRLAGPDVEYPRRLAALSAADLDAARAHYWSLVATRVWLGSGQRLLDKNPLNILRLPAIRRLFPRASILLATRHPCDVILSCYMQHFRADFGWLCRNLDVLSLAYCRTFDYWYQQAALLAPRVREVQYERYVANVESEMRALATFLELEWHDAMLAPAQRALDRGYISTPSYDQVVQPVSSRAVGRWRRYERHLAGILPRVQPYLQRWNYAGDARG